MSRASRRFAARSSVIALGALVASMANADAPAPKLPSVSASAKITIAKPAPKPKKKETPSAPPPRVELRVEARTPTTWVAAIANVGDVPLKIVADARLLRFEIEPPPSDAPSEPKAKPKKNAKKTAKKQVECALPASMRSDARTLVL